MEVLITAFAESQLKIIHSYYLVEASRKVADQLVGKILDRIDSLSKFPTKGRIEPHLQFLGMEYRFVLVKPFKIIYRIIDQKVVVLDVFHVRRNPIRLLLTQI